MDASRIAVWRDAAVILLAMQAIVVGLLPAVALFWGVRRIRQLRQWLRPVLFRTRLHVWRVQHGAGQAMGAVATPFVWLQGAAAGLRRALQMLGRR